MLLLEERRAVVNYGQRLLTHGLTRGTGGNVSVLNREQGLLAISPSGMDYFEISPEDVVVMDLEGRVVVEGFRGGNIPLGSNPDGGKRRPSSEADMHRMLYNGRPDISAVVHTHSPFATALACTREAQKNGLPPVHYLTAMAGPSVRCIPYYPFGTELLGQAARDGMADRFAVLLGNHGLLAAGPDISYAFNVAEELEFVCEIYCHARTMGTPALLSREDMCVAMERFRGYGQRS
ncbi:MAG: L-fuculose-phosphate aldolase [Fretibacterium sp.]|nr:L-fuculose-phosphate aldolase [Fretibacterium sp.]